ncbi:phage major capsid protein [Muricoccus radiodurans]|uniref:phage major capsid protein n=1 Tax=Muricoccus radiodurans TaxID=2231721 RepID=UPI003CF28F8E
MTRLVDLLARRAAATAELRGISDAAGDADLNAEQRQRFDTLRTELDTMEAAISHRAEADDRERRAAGTPLGGGSADDGREVRVRVAGADVRVPDGFDGEILVTQAGDRVPLLEHRHRLTSFVERRPEHRASPLSLGGLIRGLAFGPRTEPERRAMAEAAVGTGGALVPQVLAAEVIDAMRARSVMVRGGARTFPMDAQTVRFARLLSLPVGGWRAENAPIVESEPSLDAPTLTAHSWAVLTKISRELAEDAANLDATLRGAFAASAALAIDRAALFGAGTGNEPLGIYNTPGIQTITMGTNGGALAAWNAILDAVASLEAADAGDVTAMVAAPRTARTVAGFADTTGQPLATPPRLANVPLLTTTSVPTNLVAGTSSNTSPIILGDFREVIIGVRTQLTITLLTERYADTGQLAFVTWWRGDVLVQRPAALARITGIKP